MPTRRPRGAGAFDIQRRYFCQPSGSASLAAGCFGATVAIRVGRCFDERIWSLVVVEPRLDGPLLSCHVNLLGQSFEQMLSVRGPLNHRNCITDADS